jgi:hypothetical protein
MSQLPDTLRLLPQEIPLDHSASCNSFQPSATKPFVATPAALQRFGLEIILACLRHLQCKAQQYGGLDYLQVFQDTTTQDKLWFIEDGDGGAITALLPSDY